MWKKREPIQRVIFKLWWAETHRFPKERYRMDVYQEGKRKDLSLGSCTPLVKSCLAECKCFHTSWHWCMSEFRMVSVGPQTSVSVKPQGKKGEAYNTGLG